MTCIKTGRNNTQRMIEDFFLCFCDSQIVLLYWQFLIKNARHFLKFVNCILCPDRREMWSNFSTYETWNALLSATKHRSREYSVLADIYGTLMVNRLGDLIEDIQRVHRKVFKSSCALQLTSEFFMMLIKLVFVRWYYFCLLICQKVVEFLCGMCCYLLLTCILLSSFYGPFSILYYLKHNLGFCHRGWFKFSEGNFLECSTFCTPSNIM